MDAVPGLSPVVPRHAWQASVNRARAELVEPASRYRRVAALELYSAFCLVCRPAYAIIRLE
jgi:hypothetical protein